MNAGAGHRTEGAGPSRKPTPKELPTVEVPKAAPASVQVTLASSNKTAAPATYSLESVAAVAASVASAASPEPEAPKPRAPLVIDQTPAEQFVASAVNILRELDQGKVGVLGDKGSDFAKAHESKLAHAFGGLRHAVARLNVFA